MKYYISYFYQVRNMTPNMLPVSTSMWDPKWFHDNKDRHYIFVDKRGVINGVRFRELVMPLYKMEKLSKEHKDCTECNRLKFNQMDRCYFMNEYGNYLRVNNFVRFLQDLEIFVESRFPQIDTIIFLVHESKECSCGERPVIQEWFKENGYLLEEFK